MKSKEEELSDRELEQLMASRDLVATLKRLKIINYEIYESTMQEIILRMLKGSLNDIKQRVDQNKGKTWNIKSLPSDNQ